MVEFSPLQLLQNGLRYAKRSVFILTPNEFGETPILRARFNDAVYYSPGRKYVFPANEKVANSTMRATFQALESGGALPPYYKRLKRWTGPLLQPCDVDDFRAALNDASVYKFCVVRHPYARLVSCYRNKFEPEARGKGYPTMMRQLGFDAAREEITFEEFVRAIDRQNQQDMNPHWRPQYYNIFMDKFDYDEIINYENFAERMRGLVEKFYPEANANEALTSANRAETNSDALVDQYFNTDLKALTQKIYAIDFDKLDFDP